MSHSLTSCNPRDRTGFPWQQPLRSEVWVAELATEGWRHMHCGPGASLSIPHEGRGKWIRTAEHSWGRSEDVINSPSLNCQSLKYPCRESKPMILAAVLTSLSFPFPKPRLVQLTFFLESSRDNWRCPFHAQITKSYDLFLSHIWFMHSKQHRVWLFPFGEVQSLCFIVLWKVYWSITPSTGSSCLPLPVPLHPSWAFRSPYSHPPTPQSNTVPKARVAKVTNPCSSRTLSLHFFFHLPLTEAFFQPWHKMVKWCSTTEFNFTVQLGPWLHCQIQINVHLTNMDQGNSGWQPAVIVAIDSCVEFYALSTTAEIDWLNEFIAIIIYNFDTSQACVWPYSWSCAQCGRGAWLNC